MVKIWEFVVYYIDVVCLVMLEFVLRVKYFRFGGWFVEMGMKEILGFFVDVQVVGYVCIIEGEGGVIDFDG